MAAGERQRLLDGWRRAVARVARAEPIFALQCAVPVACSLAKMNRTGRRARWRAASSAARRSSIWSAGRASSASRRWRSGSPSPRRPSAATSTRCATQAVLQRHHGGAALASSVENIAYPDRQVLCIEEKRRIAQLVAAHIPDHASLFINIGTTTEEVARRCCAIAGCG